MRPRHEPPARRAQVCLVAVAAVLAMVGSSLGPGPAGGVNPASTPGSAGLPDEELRRMVLGRWKTVSSGERVVINRPDGTASMDVTFDFLASLLYGQKMQLELQWTVSDGILDYTITSGTPEATKTKIVDTYGAYASYRFESISELRMHLVRVRDASESYIWTRLD